MAEDAELLRHYQENRSQEAFTELVRRHVNLVYFTALRRVGGDRHLADDVTQRVFTDLARKAAALRERPVLTGWLYTSTRFAAAQAVRAEQRRRHHVTEAHAMQELQASAAAEWKRLRPVIDEAMEELSETEREAVLLRYFENCSLAEVGAKFSLSPDAARMRVERALDKLRGLLVRRGITSTGVALAALLAGQGGLAAPVGLAARVAAAAFASGGGATAAVGVAFWKLAAAGAVVVLGIGVAAYVAKPRPAEAPPGLTGPSLAGRPADPRPVSAAVRGTDENHFSGAAAVSLPQRTEPTSPTLVFAGLPSRQKNILKRLWEVQKVSPDEPPVRHGFKVNLTAPGLEEIEAAVADLRIRGLVEVGAARGVIVLTGPGRAFCAAHAAEIDDYVLAARPVGGVGDRR